MKQSTAIRDMSLCGLFAALTAICAWISLPLGDVRFTLQTFALYLGLFSLGGKRGSMAFFVYFVMGALGLPVFSGFQGGLGVLIGPTGGFLWGLLLAGPIYWFFTGCWGKKAVIPAAVLGMVLCYACGTAWYLHSYGGAWWAVALKCVVPFVAPDVAKILLAQTVARRIKGYL